MTMLMFVAVARVVIGVVIPGFQEIRVPCELGIEIEGMNIQHQIHIHLPALRSMDLRHSIHRTDPLFQSIEIRWAGEVGLVQENAIRESDLFLTFPAVIQMQPGMFGVLST